MKTFKKVGEIVKVGIVGHFSIKIGKSRSKSKKKKK